MMNKKRLAFLSLLLTTIMFSDLALAQHFWRGETMLSRTIKKKWGKNEFSKETFRNGSRDTRAKMAYTIVKNKLYVGKTVPEVRADLGAPDGYYFSDIYSAYIINESLKKGDDVWQIVFLVNNNRIISDVVVHKNCCY